MMNDSADRKEVLDRVKNWINFSFFLRDLIITEMPKTNVNISFQIDK